jgi:hypothetical protein
MPRMAVRLELSGRVISNQSTYRNSLELRIA